MKSLEELDLTVSDVTALEPKIIEVFVDRVAEARRFGRQLVRLNDRLLREKGRTVNLPLGGKIEAGDVSEGGSPPSVEIAYTSVAVTVKKIGLANPITEEAIRASEIDIIRDHIEQAGEALARKEDKDILDELLGLSAEQTQTWTGDGTTKVYTVDKKPVIVFTSVTVDGSTVDYKADYFDGKVQFVTAPASGASIVIKYKYSERSIVRDAVTKGQLKFEDVNDVVARIKAEIFEPDALVIHPEQQGNLLADTRFTEVAKYGERAPILNGEIGRFLGCAVLVTVQMYKGTALLVDRDRAGWLVLGRNPEMVRRGKEVTGQDKIEIQFFMQYKPKVTRDKALGIVVNCASDAIDL